MLPNSKTWGTGVVERWIVALLQHSNNQFLRGGRMGKIIDSLVEYMLAARQAKLPPEVVQKGKSPPLDSLAAIVSGSRLKPGQLGLQHAREQGGKEECSVLGHLEAQERLFAARATQVRREFFGPRARCPLCGETPQQDNSGYAWPEGLSRHLEGRGNVGRGSVIDIAFGH